MIFSSLIWRLAKLTPQYKNMEATAVSHTKIWAKMHASVMRDARNQQKANRVKKRKLAGLRREKRLLRGFVDFLIELEDAHPELKSMLDKHTMDRLNMPRSQGNQTPSPS